MAAPDRIVLRLEANSKKGRERLGLITTAICYSHAKRDGSSTELRRRNSLPVHLYLQRVDTCCLTRHYSVNNVLKPRQPRCIILVLDRFISTSARFLARCLSI